MSRAPGLQKKLILPPPTEKYDTTDQREVRRLITEAMNNPNDFAALSGVPTNVQQLGDLTGAADTVPYFTSVSAMALAALTPYARTILACADAVTMRTTLGLGSLATLNAVTEGEITLADVTTRNVTATEHGFAPKAPSNASEFLNGAATPGYAQVKDSDLSLSDITTNDVSTTAHGFVPKLTGVPTVYLDGTGVFSVPAGGGGGGAPALGTFPSISNLKVRLSAELSTLTRGTDNLVAQINDMTGNGNHFAATGAKRPRWYPTAYNHLRPALVFDGSLSLMSNVQTLTVGQPWTAVAVIQDYGLTGFSSDNIFRDSNFGAVFFINSGNSWAMFAGTTLSSTALFTQNQQGRAADSQGAAAVFLGVFNGASSVLSNNGVEVSGNAGTTPNLSGTLFLGGDPSSSLARFTLYEFLIFDKALSPTERGQLNTYYANACNITL